MIGAYKQFEQSEYNECNNKAIEIIKTFLRNKGYSIEDKKEDMLVDITAIKNNSVTYHEVEVKKVWKGDWPDFWTTIQVPERKGKFNTKQHFICVLSNDMTQAWYIKGTDLKKEYLKEVYNKKISKGEYFFQVPIVLAKKVKI